MRKPAILITGANGEMGHGLIHALSKKVNDNIPIKKYLIYSNFLLT